MKNKNGSDGDYLSNEIFYRVAQIRKELKPILATGHFHISSLQNEGNKEEFSISKTRDLLNKVKLEVNKGITGL